MENNGDNLWKQMEEVRKLQDRTNDYLALYQRFVTKNQEENQFLPEEQLQIEKEEEYSERREEDSKSQLHQYCELSLRAEENVEFQPKVMNLSRIFDEITLGEEVKALASINHLNVNLVVQGKEIALILSKNDNSFNLSNFSSFNNHKVSDPAPQFDIKDLLCLIQQTTGKQLSKRGIENIISQIQLSASALKEEHEALKESQITQNTLLHSQIHHQNLFRLEGELFKKTKEPLALSKSALNYKEQNKSKPTAQSFFQSLLQQKANKQNTQALHYKKRPPLASKQIRIIKKNCLKNSLIMTYTDLRQLQNFCISNKIYGKDKDKIIKAIRDNKNIVTLE